MLDISFPPATAGPFGRRQQARARRARIPVTVVTGFLGAGKTTLVRRFLATPEGEGTAVVINEYGSVGIDDALVRGATDEVTLLGNGCLCCNTRSDLQIALRNLVAEREQGTVPHVRAHPDRDQRARRSRADPADLRDRPRARRRVPRRGGGRPWSMPSAGSTRSTGRRRRASRSILADRLVVSKTDLAGAQAVDRLHRRACARSIRAPRSTPRSTASSTRAA